MCVIYEWEGGIHPHNSWDDKQFFRVLLFLFLSHQDRHLVGNFLRCRCRHPGAVLLSLYFSRWVRSPFTSASVSVDNDDSRSFGRVLMHFYCNWVSSHMHSAHNNHQIQECETLSEAVSLLSFWVGGGVVVLPPPFAAAAQFLVPLGSGCRNRF